MRLAIPFLAASIAACSTGPTREELIQRAQASSTQELCDVIALRPQHRELALSELRRRNQDCDWNRVNALAQQRQAEIAARQAADAQTNAAIMGWVNQQQAATNALNQRQPTTNCRTVKVGNTWQTQCY